MAADIGNAIGSQPGPRAGGGALDFLAGGGETGARMRALDWTRTPLGAPEQWPQSLKTIVRVMLDSRYAMWMLWGPELTFFCNDAYLPTVGIKRDWVLGARSDKVWEEIWPDIGPRIGRVLAQGQATWDESLLLFLERSGFPEETYHTFSYSPIYNDQNRIAGMLCVVTETTERVIGERRLRALHDLAARGVSAGAFGTGENAGVEASCRRACEVLALYSFDTPFAALYLIDAAAGAARLAACTHALPETTLPEKLSLEPDASPWPVAALVQTETPQTVTALASLGLAIQTDPWLDGVHQAVLLPLKGAQHGLVGFLLAGVSPRRELDDAYRSFLNLVANQAASAIAEAQAYEAERRRAESLAELDRAKTAFFSNVSHEFRTPLTLMLGPLEEVIGDARVPPGARIRLELAQRNATRLHKLVNSLLDFSRIEAGRVEASYEETDLAAATRDLASTFRSAMERAGLAFSVDCEDLGEPVYVDREMWEKIVLNLLSNAFKFTLAGGVAVRLRRAGDCALLEVIDTGVGVPEHELPRLFERFHRVEVTQGRSHEGSGIGLALVHELVKLHGASIDADSTLGAGTRFRIQLPFGTAHLPAERVRASRALTSTAIGARTFVQEALRWLQDPADAARAGQQPLAEAAPGVRDRRFAATFGSRIVLADDNADVRAYVRDLLAPYYSVEAVADGEAALATAHRSRPDLVLSDVMMPRLDGYGLLAAIRADESLRSTPVLLLSARAGEEARIEGLDAGADDYVVKPFSARELLARVGALLELRHMRRTAEEGFRRRTAQYETLLTEAPLGVFLVDAAMRIREVNPTALATFGDIPDLIGRDLDEVMRRLWSSSYADEIVRAFQRTLETGEPMHAPERSEARVDRRITEHYEWRINRIPLADGTSGVVCYFRDISIHVHARARLQQADRQKDEFLAMLAHELRNPLAPIRSAGEVLARTAPAGSHAERASAIVERQVGYLTRLVDDLLDVSRITQGRVELRRRPVALAEVISRAVEIVAPLIKEKHHRISITSRQMLRVDADPARMVQCVANVLTNAAKYTDPQGEIRVDSRDDGDAAVLTISDDGVGMGPDLVPRVFDLFVQSERTSDRAQGGLGIGLSVVKRLIEMHGGTVSAASAGIGAGSSFEIRLPLLVEQDAEVAVAEPARRPSPRRVLVVDDKKDAANSLAMILTLEGHQVESVNSAQEALDRVVAFRPDVALLDIGLPGMNGYELAARLRTLPELAPIRLVALTGYGQAEDIERARAAGFDYHLVKPADLRALQRALDGVPLHLATSADGQPLEFRQASLNG
jgi:PAS domain S-box-containing protein